MASKRTVFPYAPRAPGSPGVSRAGKGGLEMLRSVLFLGALAAAFFALVSVAPASPAGQLCPSFSKGGLTYHWETAGTGWTCGSAKPWVLKLSSDRIADPNVRKVVLRNGPAGFHCLASARTKGRASSGVCYKNTLAFPKSGFTWFGS